MKSELSIPLGNEKYATIDLCDLDKIEGYLFCLKERTIAEYAKGYKATWGMLGTRGLRGPGLKGSKRKGVMLHHLILGAPPVGLECAHQDGNKLNCTRRNLRWLTHTHNLWGKRKKTPGTSSKYRGVTWNKDSKKWMAQTSKKGKHFFLGRFTNEEDAARAYDQKARELFGEYVSPNFP